MAKNDNVNGRQLKNINNSLDSIDSKMNDIFQNTYNSRSDNKDNLENITDDIYKTVNSIIAGNEEIQNIPNITRLYARMNKENNEMESNIREISDVLSNNAIINSITTTPETSKYIKSLDTQYDMICKYMPKLEKALEIKKDNVLSADNFNKEFINIISDQLASDDKLVFDERNIALKKKYNIDDLFDKIYDETSKYGEYFLYSIPYKKAMEQLLKTKGVTTANAVRFESAVIMENGVITGSKPSNGNKESNNGNVNIQFDTSNLLSESVLQYHNAEKLKKKLSKKKSMNEAFYESVDIVTEKKDNNKIFDDTIDYGKEFDNVANDGLVDTSKKKNNDVKIDEIPGCINKKLKHENVIPIYIEDICIGYYYFEFSFNDNYDPARNNIINSSAFPQQTNVEGREDIYAENPLLRELAKKISDNVDEKFINNNQDIKDEIYIMLKYNEKFNVAYDTNNIRVTFLPVEDVYHFYFKLDEETHHGISDLQRSLVPAMFWCLLDLSTTLGIVTRSQDKRIYYVKQNVETNVARTLMNVINQVKKGNFGIRQMESMNNILNIVGRYNDHVIPMGPNGDAPIQFEVMSGQQIDTPEQLLNKWEEAAIDPTDVPLEWVNSSMQADFAIKYTMSNSIFLRKVMKRQFICETKFTEIYTRIYNYEYIENEFRIKVQLPAPAFLSMTNGSQLLQNTKEFIANIADTEYPNGPEEEKAEFSKLMLRYYMPTHINVPLIDRLKSEAKVNIATIPKTDEE